MSTQQLLGFVGNIARALKRPVRLGLAARLDSLYIYHPVRMNPAGRRQHSL